jgi:hypothetical protein
VRTLSRFIEFQQLDAADSRREHVFMKLCKRNRPGMLAAFALVKKVRMYQHCFTYARPSSPR